MSEQSNIDIRYGVGRWLYLGCAGLFLGGSGLYLLLFKDYGDHPVIVIAMCVVLVFVGIIGGFGAANRLLDRSVKLSLTAEGLKDHRTGTLIRWPDFGGVRLDIHRSGKIPVITSAMLYVKLAHNDSDTEVCVDVYGLDHSPDEISEIVQRRGIAAVRDVAVQPRGRDEPRAVADRPRD